MVNMSMDDMNKMTGESGTITFIQKHLWGHWFYQGKQKLWSGAVAEGFIEHVNGKTLTGYWGYDYQNPGGL